MSSAKCGAAPVHRSSLLQLSPSARDSVAAHLLGGNVALCVWGERPLLGCGASLLVPFSPPQALLNPLSGFLLALGFSACRSYSGAGRSLPTWRMASDMGKSSSRACSPLLEPTTAPWLPAAPRHAGGIQTLGFLGHQHFHG